MKNLITYFWIALLLSKFAISQDKPAYQKIDETAGLPTSTIYSLIEDENHKIWLATDQGLSTYDGKAFTNIRHSKQKGNAVFNLSLNQYNIWYNNIYGQLFKINYQSINPKLQADLKKELGGDLANFYIEKDIKLFSEKGIFKITPDSKVKKITKDQAISSISTGNENYYINQLGHLKDFKSESVLKRFNFSQKKAQLLTIQGDVYVYGITAKHNQLYHIKSAKFFELDEKLSETSIIKSKQIGKEQWLLTKNGAFLVDIEADKLIVKKHVLATYQITDVIRDFNNNYWYTSLNDGIFIIKNFQFLTLNLNFNKSSINELCRINENKIAVANNKGEFIIKNLQNGNIEDHVVLPHDLNVGKMLYLAASNELIISCTNEASFSYNLNSKQVKNLGNKYAVAKALQAISKDSLLYLPYNKSIIKTETADYLLDSIRPNTGYYNKTSKQVFVSSVEGLKIYDLETLKTQKVLDNIYVSQFANSKSSNTWIATFDHKLYKISIQGNIQAFKLQNKLKNKTIASIAVDQQQRLWISTSNNIYVYNEVRNSLQLLDIFNNYDSHFYKLMSVGNSILIETKNQLLYFKDAAFYSPNNYTIPQPRINQVRINNHETINRNNTVEYHQRDIKFTFQANGLNANQLYSYAYKLGGYEADWSYTGVGIQSVNYINIPPGSYSFKAKTVYNNDFSKDIAEYQFTVKKAYWQTWWFVTLVIGLTLLVILIIYKFISKRRNFKKEEELKKAILESRVNLLKLENLRSQMNPHFIFNALNSIQDYILANEKKLASKYLIKFSRLVRIYLNHSQKNTINLQEELQALELYLSLEQLRFEDTLTYNIVVDQALQQEKIKVPSLFIQPYVENAIKHGLLHKKDNRILQINFKSIKNSSLVCEIIDNGIGRDESMKINQKRLNKPASFAMTANNERVNLYNRINTNQIKISIEDISKDNKIGGTKVTIHIPY
ncbi:Y_Y_Y domain-containing protein [Psychroflexus salarius]|uniref:Y_Y_Y domain-containing protein n=1 Tax=Psychroflexus salarius TaxID=1155689 RepID=A0A1M4WBJ2_9FLAO|nr:histidine kinase [Psychroflexus salarius]SHE78641.1 Y_Y_Y domain-containing protein [Psychroflexus salarius]